MASVSRFIARHSKKSPKKDFSVAPEILRTPEEDFLTLVSGGNVNNVRLFLKNHTKEHPEFNANRVNFKNTNAMSIAIEGGNWEMVKFLIKVMRISKRRVLLKAIHEGDLNLVQNLCEEMEADLELSSDEAIGEDEYPPNITPLMLAAMEGHYEIIGFLINRGHLIPVPHPPSCLCKETCLYRLENSDKLDLASFTYCQYSAMSSPQYFVYITLDPIHYAFKIHKRLIDLSDIERPFKQRYERLAQNVREFAADLVGECKDAREIELVLNKRISDSRSILENYVTPEVYPRLLMAMEYQQKEFVTHPKIQLVLQDRFYGAFEDWKYYSNMSKLIFPAIRLCTFPSALFSIIFYPSSAEARFYAAPLNRMLHSLMFYIIFLVVLLLESLRDKSRVLQPNMGSVWTVIIFVYFCTMTAATFHQILHLRPARFFRNGWNIFDVVMLTMFGLYLAFNVASIFHYVIPHVRNKERKLWAGSEPQLAAEGFLVVASVLAYLKLMFFLQAHSVVGPLQVALGQIIKACARYSFFDVIILLAYSTAFSKYYAYYEGMTFCDPITKDISFQEQSFVNWMSSFKTFFWAMFTQLDPAVADVVVENLNKTTCQVPSNDHIFTEFVGYLGLGTFSLLVLMVIVNMLIAAISETYANIVNDVHKSWLFVRTEIYIYFMNYPFLPPPFNFIPHFYRIRDLKERADVEQARVEQGKLNYRQKYQNLVKCLVKRYFSNMKRRNDQMGPTEPATPEIQKWLETRSQHNMRTLNDYRE